MVLKSEKDIKYIDKNLKLTYNSFRTPFVEIYIFDAKGNNKVKLPPQIMKLVEKVEVMETICCSSFNQINIVFNEGSREPFPTAEGHFASKDIYPIPGGASSFLSNQTGMLVDLKFSEGGLTSVPAGVSTVVTTTPSDAAQADDGDGEKKKNNKNPNPVEEVEDINIPYKGLTYLFQQRNQILIKWGYRELGIVRATRGYIMMVTSEFPEKGTPRTTIVAHGSGGITDQIATVRSAVLGNKTKAGTSESGKSMEDFESADLVSTIKDICKKAGIKYIVSENFEYETYEAGKAPVWSHGKSFEQFFTKLANDHNAIYKVQTDPSTGEDYVIFISRKDWYGSPLQNPDYLFTYKGTNSIIKSISIKADFGQGVGSFMSAIDDQGTKILTNAPAVSLTLFELEKHQDNNPTGNNAPVIAKGLEKIANGGTGFKSGVTAKSESKANLKNWTQAYEDKEASANLVGLEFSCLGFPGLTPGLQKFDGIGDRYTGVYDIKNVTHVIDSNGYNCRGYATSFKNAQGGITPKSASQVEGTTGVQVKVKLYRDIFLHSNGE